MSLVNPRLFTIARDGDRLSFRCTRAATAGTAAILAAAVAFFGFPLVAAAWEGQLDGSAFSLGLIPAALLGVLAWVAVRWRAEHTLDRAEGTYRHGRRQVCRLDEIADVIVIAHDPPDSGPTFEAFFRLRDGRRIKLTPVLRPMARRDEAEAFARALADFLAVEALGDFRECERAGG